jgi:hypothetical protein
MAEHQTFTGFFSYANHDAKTDPGLITAFTRQLEYSINAKLANARFQIWRDKDGLRTGERWSDTINDELRRAAVLIVLLTPRWIESEYCRKEFAVFAEVEASRRVGDYVAPILARPIEQQKKHLTPAQLDVLARIADRQYFKAIANDFLTLTEAQRIAEIDKVADDIAGMIDRLRSLARMPARSVIARRYTGRRGLREFSARAEDYAEVDSYDRLKCASTALKTMASAVFTRK